MDEAKIRALIAHWKSEGKRCYNLAHKNTRVDKSIMAQSVRFWMCADELEEAMAPEPRPAARRASKGSK